MDDIAHRETYIAAGNEPFKKMAYSLNLNEKRETETVCTEKNATKFITALLSRFWNRWKRMIHFGALNGDTYFSFYHLPPHIVAV